MCVDCRIKSLDCRLIPQNYSFTALLIHKKLYQCHFNGDVFDGALTVYKVRLAFSGKLACKMIKLSSFSTSMEFCISPPAKN